MIAAPIELKVTVTISAVFKSLSVVNPIADPPPAPSALNEVDRIDAQNLAFSSEIH